MDCQEEFHEEVMNVRFDMMYDRRLDLDIGSAVVYREFQDSRLKQQSRRFTIFYEVVVDIWMYQRTQRWLRWDNIIVEEHPSLR